MENINIFKSLARFQQTCPIIYKATEGYGYNYASFDLIVKTINPIMQKCGLGFSQLLETREDCQGLRTIVFHAESGEYVDSFVLIPKGVKLKGMNEFQVDGSAITYYKRYALSSILGIITDKDIDGAGEQLTGNGIKDNRIDPQAMGDELNSQLAKAIVAISKGIKEEPSIQLSELEGCQEIELRSTFEEYKIRESDYFASKWIDQQLTMKTKSGSVDALRKLWKEAETRGFLNAEVELKIKQRKEELGYVAS